MSAETERSQPKLWPTRERITTPSGSEIHTRGYRILECCWLALVPCASPDTEPDWDVHHAPSGLALHRVAGQDRAVSLLQLLAEEEWLRSAAVPLVGEDKERFDSIVRRWRAA